MVLPGFNSPVKFLIQGQDSVTKHHLSTCCSQAISLQKKSKLLQFALFRQLLLLQMWKQDLWKTLKKNKEIGFFVKLEPPPGSPGPAPLVAGRAGRWWWLGAFVPPWPQASEWSDCWDADCACNATSDGSLHS